GGIFSSASSVHNVGMQNIGITFGSSTTLQTLGVRFSKNVGTQGNTSFGLVPIIGGGSRGLGGLGSSGSGGSRGGGNTG
ncbi:hypothetical protein KI387_024260, partial [Taxus chinensis]